MILKYVWPFYDIMHERVKKQIKQLKFLFTSLKFLFTSKEPSYLLKNLIESSE